MMPPLAGITCEASRGLASASWGALPAYSELELFAYSYPGPGVSSSETVVATAGWIQATGADQLAFDVQPPGFEASWHVDPAQPYGCSFQARSKVGDVSYSTGVGLDGR
jgi:hypothetical protein